MLYGAMDTRRIGDPWDLATDVGPVIDHDARRDIERHGALFEKEGRLLPRAALPKDLPHGSFVPPTVFKVDGLRTLHREVAAPALHVATSDDTALARVLDAVLAAAAAVRR